MNKQAFTLAEVLITLGIIGVVAAMTIPTLISNTNGAQFKSAYKKSLSTLNQAAIMNIALDDYDFSSLRVVTEADPENPDQEVTSTSDYGIETKKTMAYLLKNRLQSVSNFVYTEEEAVQFSADENSILNGTDTDDYYSFSFADGTTFSYNKLAEKCKTEDSANCFGFIDVNGKTGPNIEIECTNNEGKVTGPEGEAEEGEEPEAIACEVESSGITDIYPVRFYGQTLVPATEAARTVLYTK